MSLQISRRDFLKLSALLSLLRMDRLDRKWQHFVGAPKSTSPNPDAPNILILVFDALSAKNMSLYGYRRETTPNLARFAEKATVFHRHYAGGNFTTPGTASLLTGTYPWSHRGFHPYGTVAESYVEKNLFNLFASVTYNRIAYTHNHLATILLNQFRADLDVLKKTGELCLFNENIISERVSPDEYSVALSSEIALFWGGAGRQFIPSSLFLSMLHRIWRVAHKRNMSEEYANLFPRGIPSTTGNPIFFFLEHAIDWIKVQLDNLSQPFLGYFHLLPPHDPYTTRRDFIDMFDDGWTPVAKPPHHFSEGQSDEFLNQKRREYDEYIAYADAEFGRLYDFMAQTGVLDNTIVVFTSDHGEMFERGILGHTTLTLYEAVTRIPLLISRPGQRQREDVYTPTSCVDLLPTLLHATGQTIPDWCEGKVLPAFGGGEASSGRSIFAVEAKSNPKLAPLTKGTVALIKAQYKLIHYFGSDGYEDGYELYDLVNDPEEMKDLYSSKGSIAAEFQSELDEKLREANQPYVNE